MRGATLRRGNATTLADISFALAGGEILGVAGCNGAGKSSLLHLACNELAPGEGKVLLAGEDLAAIRPRDRAQRMAVLPQHMQLQFDFTVGQVIALGRSPHGDSGAGGKDIINFLLDTCELQDLAQRHYQTLSGGEQQRTQFARVLAQLLREHPDENLAGQVLVLDEPTASLDIRHQEQLVHMVKMFRDRGCAVLLVMHDINLLSRCADRLLLLKQGRVHSLAPTAEQLNETTLSELFEFPMKVQPRAFGELPLVYPDSGQHAF